VAFDPQTSGGLLIAVPEREAEALARALLNEGVFGCGGDWRGDVPWRHVGGVSGVITEGTIYEGEHETV
jgi:hypothetical protein